jgi:Ca2+-transporting ATPase
MPSENWHEWSADEVLELLGSTSEGLSSADAARRLDVHGPNLLTEAPRRSHARRLIAQFIDPLILILIGAAVIAGVIGDLADSVIILVIVVLNALMGFVQEFRAERAMAALKALAAPEATVLRDGTPKSIPVSLLVPGDIVVLEAGSLVPADTRLTEAASLRIDESALTGESVPVDKTTAALQGPSLPLGDRKNIAYKGTSVTYGRGRGVVFATAMQTELGRIAVLLQQDEVVETPLQRRLAAFGQRLAFVILIICAIVFTTGLLRGEPTLHMFLTALSLAVAAIPEALPVVIGISLALGARKLAAQHALIRHLPAVETLGSVTYICSDKTGTLTANEMRVEQYYCDGERRSSPGTSAPWQRLFDAMVISHDAALDADGSALGDPTEIAILRAAQAAGRDHRASEARMPRIDEIPFDSTRRCMTTIHRDRDGTVISFTKGAAEAIVERSTHEWRGTARAPIDRDALLRVADAMAADGLRVLAIGTRTWASPPDRVRPDAIEHDLDFIGLVGMIDPPRPEVPAAIATCLEAGIVPVMITGDHPLTARAVARRLGLLADDGIALAGPEIEAWSNSELESRVRDVRVYARISPEQKLRIVAALQKAGEAVAVTGDGVNDAPALRRADIGISMGLAGTDVARQASDMVLLDDNFATVVRAVRGGRRIYDNLRRFLRYVLTTNSAEIWTIFLAPFLGLPVPLLPSQILWINVVTDGLPGLAITAEPAERDLMRRPPRPVTESIFAQGLGLHALLFGIFMAALVIAVQSWYVHTGSAAWQTAAFTTLCFTQLAHVLAIRSDRVSLFAQGLRSNMPLALAVALSLGLQLLVIYLPASNALFKTVPLDAWQMAVCLASALAVFALVELEKWLRRRGDRSAAVPAAAAQSL